MKNVTKTFIKGSTLCFVLHLEQQRMAVN